MYYDDPIVIIQHILLGPEAKPASWTKTKFLGHIYFTGAQYKLVTESGDVFIKKKSHMGNLVQCLAQAYYNGTWGLWTGSRVPACRLLITGKSVWPLGHAASLQDGPDPRARDHNRSPCIDLQTFGVVSVASCPYVTHTHTHTKHCSSHMLGSHPQVCVPRLSAH